MICASTHRASAPARRRASSRRLGRSSAYTPNFGVSALARPRVLRRRVERRAGEVQPGARAVRREYLGLESGQHPQALRVALEPADRLGELVQRGLAVVAERRMAEVVREARGVDQVGVGAQRDRELAADLRALQRVGQPGPREVALPDTDHLGPRREPPQRDRVQHPGAVADELVPLDPLGASSGSATRRSRVVSSYPVKSHQRSARCRCGRSCSRCRPRSRGRCSGSRRCGSRPRGRCAPARCTP